jgi:hypothetical protein
MELEQQVVSLELSRKLKELGVKQQSLFWWMGQKYGPSFPAYNCENVRGVICAAYTVAELGGMLPALFKVEDKNTWAQWFAWTNGEYFYIGYDDKEGTYIPSQAIAAETEADARAKMLIYLLENKLI